MLLDSFNSTWTKLNHVESSLDAQEPIGKKVPYLCIKNDFQIELIGKS